MLPFKKNASLRVDFLIGNEKNFNREVAFFHRSVLDTIFRASKSLELTIH